MRPLPLRPPGLRDLAHLESHAGTRLEAWARAWLGTGRATAQVQVAACGTGTEPGPDELAALGRLCLGCEAVPAGMRLPPALCATLGRAALQALAQALGVAAAAATSDAAPARARTLGLRLVIEGEGVALAWGFDWPLAAWAEALPPVRSSARAPGPFTLPRSVEQSPHRVALHSAPFELAVADVLSLAAGDVLVLDQALDEPFRLVLPGLPGAELHAHLGRHGAQLAAELLPH